MAQTKKIYEIHQHQNNGMFYIVNTMDCFDIPFSNLTLGEAIYKTDILNGSNLFN
mgnify:CR=1 FL=1